MNDEEIIIFQWECGCRGSENSRVNQANRYESYDKFLHIPSKLNCFVSKGLWKSYPEVNILYSMITIYRDNFRPFPYNVNTKFICFKCTHHNGMTIFCWHFRAFRYL